MPHHFLDLAAVILLASLAAVLLSKLKQQPMIGYVIAGVVIGPAGFRIIEDQSQISFVAEMGVILLLFVLGMELPLTSFKDTYKTALPVALLLVLLSFASVFTIGFMIDISMAEKIVYAFIISLSSTAVAVKLLEDVDMLTKGTGQVAISVLIAQDLLFVPMIMTVNTLGSDKGVNLLFIPKILAAIAILIGLIVFLLRKQKVHLLFEQTVEKHNDLIPVAALSWCFVGAGLSEYAGLSPAYGAFLAGLVIGNSFSKDKVLHRIEPMQSVLLMIFFLSIGMLLDFGVIVSNAPLIFSLLLATMLFKTVVSILLLKAFLPSDRWRCSFVTGLTISQIGEFSFIIAAAALANGVFDNESYKIIIAVIALSLALSPVWLTLLHRFVQISYIDQSAKTLSAALRQCVMKRQPDVQ